MGKQVRNLNRICRCSDSLSNMWRRGPLLSEQRRQRSVNAVKLRSSGSVIAKHLMRRSRRQELSMYTAVVFGWRETSTHVAGSQGGVAPPLRSGGTGPCAPGAPLSPPTPSAPPPPPRPHTPHVPHTPPSAWLGRAGKCVPVFPSAIADCPYWLWRLHLYLRCYDKGMMKDVSLTSTSNKVACLRIYCWCNEWVYIVILYYLHLRKTTFVFDISQWLSVTKLTYNIRKY